MNGEYVYYLFNRQYFLTHRTRGKRTVLGSTSSFIIIFQMIIGILLSLQSPVVHYKITT